MSIIAEKWSKATVYYYYSSQLSVFRIYAILWIQNINVLNSF